MKDSTPTSAMPEMGIYRPLNEQYCDEWHWNDDDKSDAVILYGEQSKIAQFHNIWSNGTAGVRGSKPINLYPNRYYWEVLIKDRLFGTSMMIGLTTQSASLHSDSFVNLIGENEFGWGLSHKGLIWHNGQWKIYTKPFRENRSTLIGCLYDGRQGTMTYFKDGENLGIAFTGLNLVKEYLYPTVCSTAAKTEFIITFSRRDFVNLQDRCRNVIRNNLRNQIHLDKLNIPKPILSYLKMDEENSVSKHWKNCCKYRQYSKSSSNLAQSTKIPMPDF